MSRAIGRRAILVGTTACALGCNTDKPREGALGAMERWNTKIERALLSSGKRAADPGPKAVTREGDFPVYFVSPAMPAIPAGWTLRVGGMVARPLSLSPADLERLARTDVRVRHHCVEGWSAVASWHGVAVRELARIAGADPAAKYVEFRSFDAGYTSSWDLESAVHAQTILAYGMNGAPLDREHGAPLRLYSGIKLGYKNVKYLTEVLFLPNETGGYWEDRGYEWFAGT